MAKIVSKTYGEALFELATEESRANEMLEEIQAVRKILNENPQFGELMLHPGIAKQEKLKMVDNIFKGRVSDDLTGFLNIIVENERFKELDSVFEYFIDKAKESQGIGVAHVATPKPLSDKEKADVEAKLLETTDYIKMEMNYSIDESLIGGMVIRVGDRVVDSSIRTKLDGLTKELLKIQLG